MAGAGAELSEPALAGAESRDTPASTTGDSMLDDDLETASLKQSPTSTIGHSLVKQWGRSTYGNYDSNTAPPSPTGSFTSSLSDVLLPDMDAEDDLLTHLGKQDQLIFELKNKVGIQSKVIKKQAEMIEYLKAARKLNSALQADKEKLKEMKEVSEMGDEAAKLVGKIRYFYGDVENEVE